MNVKGSSGTARILGSACQLTTLRNAYATAPLGTKLLSLFPDRGYAAGYKVTQRMCEYGGQPWFRDILARNY
ncbi:uncharacterized protein B0H18DRAFT_1120607 [Fomitopsis serialis]|uniref:uncharacterized protein n=1 Tax=Fomitopsis serialis TaxID=139415 RepID=UPI0020077235|nr:uncharacterized protein B0H18DRAFT_1120607 [Neoantrodia serialis]KAH9923084.1 hypothetical protein B0H18DRAFT_1120607 [Neoantrodia serialis]